MNICKEEVKPFPPVINQVEKYLECFSIQSSCLKIYFGSLDMRLLLNILTETQVRKCPLRIMIISSPTLIILQGLWAALLILELFDPEFRALFKAKLAKVARRNTNESISLL